MGQIRLGVLWVTAGQAITCDTSIRQGRVDTKLPGFESMRADCSVCPRATTRLAAHRG